MPASVSRVEGSTAVVRRLQQSVGLRGLSPASRRQLLYTHSRGRKRSFTTWNQTALIAKAPMLAGTDWSTIQPPHKSVMCSALHTFLSGME